MKHKETIAVIGAACEEGKKVIGFLINTGHRLLLMDEATEQLQSLQQALSPMYPQAEIDIIPCSREACWEADLIIIVKTQPTLEATITKIKEVATNKIVACITSGNLQPYALLQKDLPHSRIVAVQLNAKNKEPQFTGSHHASVDTVAALFTSAEQNAPLI
jgi:arginine/ornithine N-succinyltransferase beta subunit